MAAANVVTGYDPASTQVLTTEISSPAQTMPSEDEYLDDMVRLWQRKQAKSKVCVSTTTRHRSWPPFPSGARNAGGPSLRWCVYLCSLLAARQRKWRPRQTPRLSRDNYIVVVKPCVPCELHTFVLADRAGDAIRRYLGDRTTTQIQVWPIWEQNILVSLPTTATPSASRATVPTRLGPVAVRQNTV
ncbi:hypothetical protein HPB50_021407 [Hyalomma asiaticum]|uniref:Uncharacterized protein n=1 Tax=Hyalomma asiaticum TaxID=266040 RepID=A0ACB7RQ96_HYAAI|nr:hypothetical protein HPB50_021407 [Hyalomma asiaticum]